MPLLVGVAVLLALGPTQTAASSAATLTVFTGTAQVEPANSTTFAPARSGQVLVGGDTVLTGQATRAAINYPDGASARLDSNTQLTVKTVRRSGADWLIDANQTLGKTWHRVPALIRGESYTVSAPNHSTAEVRGTEFSIYIETTKDGRTIARFDTWSGSVDVSAQGARVTVTAGESTTVFPDSAPTPPVPISEADRGDSFTVFNQTLDNTAGDPVGFRTATLSPPETTELFKGANGDGQSDLEFTLGWPGSTFELIVYDPAGAEYKRAQSPTPTLSIVVPSASKGTWSYRVHDLISLPDEHWWVIVSRLPRTPGTATLQLNSIAAKPAPAVITAGQSVTFTVEGFDRNFKSLGDVTAGTTFSISPDGSCSRATCTAKIAGTHTVTAQNSGAEFRTALTVNAGPLAIVSISPAAATITANGSQAFTAQGFDLYGNGLGDATASSTFSIAPDGSCSGTTCTATAAGAHTVTGTHAGKFGTATLTVNPGPLASITLSPSSATAAVGASQTYAANGFDVFNNSLGDVTTSTVFTIAPDGTCAGAQCFANSAGPHVVTGTNEGKTATADLTVTQSLLAFITLSPSTASISAGGGQAYTVKGYDLHGNVIGDFTASTTFNIAPDGTCTGSRCTAVTAGVHIVTGTNSGNTANATLTVSPGALASLALSPSSAIITLGGSQTYSALGFDQYGNSLGDVTGSTVFTIAPDGTCAVAGSLANCAPSTAGAHTVTGTDGGITGTATLAVNKATPVITWSSPFTIAYGTALSSTQLNASASVPGSFVYSPAAGTVLGAGSQTLSTTFTPTDTADYNGASATVTLTVTKALLTANVTGSQVFGGSPAFSLTFSGFLNGDTAAVVSGSLACSTSATSSSPVGGGYSISACSGLTAANYRITYSYGTLTVTPAPTTVTLGVPVPTQYSDPVTFAAIVTPSTATGTVQFAVAGVNTGSPVPVSGGAATFNYVVAKAPGPYSVTATFTSSDANFTNSNSPAVTLTVSPEDARTSYTGGTSFTGTAGATIPITLSANLADITACNFGPTGAIPCSPADNAGNDTSPGDIRTASLTFVDGFSGSTLCTATIAVVSTAAPTNTVATASCTWSVLVSAASAIYEVDILVGGNYTAPFADAFIDVGPPSPSNAIKVNNGVVDLAGTASGTCHDAAGTPIQTKASVGYTFVGGLPTGGAGAIDIGFTSATSCTPGDTSTTPHKYDVKATVVTNVTRPPSAVNTASATVDATSVTILDETATGGPKNATTLTGTATFTVHIAVTDNSGIGQPSTIAVQIRDGSGNLWFSSDWNGTLSVQQPLIAGSLTVT